MSNEIKQGDIVVFKTGNRAFEVVGKYIVTDDRLWRVEAIDENDPPTPDRNRKYRLVAVDCPNVILENIPERYVESYSEKLERELEEQRKEALKMNRNEIKQGDKVRVSKGAPRIYTPDWVDAMFDLVLKVTEVEDDNAMVEFEKRTSYRTVLTAIPTKYLIKVDAEAKEAKHIFYGDYAKRSSESLEKLKRKAHLEWHSSTEPTEQTEAEKMQNATASELRDLANHGVAVGDEVKRRIKERDEKPNVGSIKIPVEVDLSDSYWDAYAADLAKELALKVANKFNTPHEAAEYAVSVAKAVVEGLKRK